MLIVDPLTGCHVQPDAGEERAAAHGLAGASDSRGEGPVGCARFADHRA